MYITVLVEILAAYPYLFQLDWCSRVILLFVYGRVSQPRYVCDAGKY